VLCYVVVGFIVVECFVAMMAICAVLCYTHLVFILRVCFMVSLEFLSFVYGVPAGSARQAGSDIRGFGMVECEGYNRLSSVETMSMCVSGIST
jgi:uncharacterized membrane protein